ncbi:hypothetical protein MSG28_016158 [Choristoneura fumiferana]|uniref:Uncharacterized protein n=1 Tax=Choristoneura fumiferana TaxID=7141 RepID=A0ACC0K604_CHOFU|nr:hypothetical protein MSG28_016158 [Choristoneura fumiferana]
MSVSAVVLHWTKTNSISFIFSVFKIMMEENSDEKILLPHHEQQPLCTTRLPYRQGRKLTAVKVYTINSESNHLLIFGVPALNLRQEAKALFHKFGKLKLFTITKEHKAEQFTETYHTVFDRIQSARMAKKMLDTKNFYGGSLHVTYAPELESLEETRVKLAQRKYDVLARLKNLQKEEVPVVEKVELVEDEKVAPKLNMGEENIIQANGLVRKRKYKHEGEKFKPCFISNEDNQESDSQKKTTKIVENVPGNIQNMVEKENSNVEIVDCTSVNVETITNINEHLNVDRFDNIRIYKVPEKPVNKIKFNVRFSFYLLNIFNGMAVIRKYLNSCTLGEGMTLKVLTMRSGYSSRSLLSSSVPSPEPVPPPSECVHQHRAGHEAGACGRKGERTESILG